MLSPDYFFGDPVYLHRGVEPDFDGATWVPNKRKLADPFVPPWIEAVKTKYGAYAAVQQFQVVGLPHLSMTQAIRTRSGYALVSAQF